MFSQIPTNIITGFLGVGKTTAIQYLLANKPENERWAVLVNEFGEVGIDAGLMNNESEVPGVFIKELPGGCMCCTAGVPMQIALNQLIRQSRPDRLLIEPTGLGHPKEVVETLRQPEYSGVLDLRCTITLVDIRKLRDNRYTSHETFNQQLQVADLIVANKTDLYTASAIPELEEYLSGHSINTPVESCSNGQLKLDWLDQPSGFTLTVKTKEKAAHFHDHSLEEDVFPESGFLRKDNKGEGYSSSGWIFSPEFEFDFARLELLLTGITAERLKAVFITDEGIYAFNLADSILKVQALDEVMDSRIEVIGETPANWTGLEAQLLAMATRC
ncbi:CobW family GTP-binding protein [Amphritea japonica]|uniref:CobW C-terminal domain-containing protein n=1 Tax=Amphritea japonica ATCC BAA-1530 TaxID=1278309 RepID=A0A7R6PBX0_9GAMM|nr:GTP-binding protein [Amphritea japonica]BBB25286.1 conserved hypothetical protein [Amphritea japonica ATCC BAA-1530]